MRMLVAVTMRHAALFHPLTGARLRPVGYRRDGRPIMPILGGAPREDDDFEPDPGDRSGADDAADDDADDDDADDDDADDPNDDSGDDDTDDGKGRTKAPVKPDGKPYTQADVDKLARSLRAARRTARSKKDGADGKGADGKDATEPDDATVAARAEDVAAKTWKPLIVNQAARAALVEAGLIGKPDRLLRLLDPEDVDVDPETGDIDGLDEQIAELRREYRHLFRRTGTRRLDASRDRDGDGRGRGKLTATELQALQLTGRA